jgi:hypothetical protein
MRLSVNDHKQRGKGEPHLPSPSPAQIQRNQNTKFAEPRKRSSQMTSNLNTKTRPKRSEQLSSSNTAAPTHHRIFIPTLTLSTTGAENRTSILRISISSRNPPTYNLLLLGLQVRGWSSPCIHNTGHIISFLHLYIISHTPPTLPPRKPLVYPYKSLTGPIKHEHILR